MWEGLSPACPGGLHGKQCVPGQVHKLSHCALPGSLLAVAHTHGNVQTFRISLDMSGCRFACCPQSMGVAVKMVTGDQYAIAVETCKRLGMGHNIMEGKAVMAGLKVGAHRRM